MCFYAQKSKGHWDRITDYDGRVVDKIQEDFTILSSYVAFGFEVDVLHGTSWPYSGVFWTAEDTAKKGTPSKIDIELGGDIRNVSIQIKADDKVVYNRSGCTSNHRYGWNDITLELTM